MRSTRPLPLTAGVAAVAAAVAALAPMAQPLSAAATGGTSEPADLIPLEFQISWLPGGDNLAFWMGVEQGFFADEGLDVTIRSSNDPTQSIRLAAAGELPMVQAYTGDVIISASQGDPVISLLRPHRRQPVRDRDDARLGHRDSRGLGRQDRWRDHAPDRSRLLLGDARIRRTDRG